MLYYFIPCIYEFKMTAFNENSIQTIKTQTFDKHTINLMQSLYHCMPLTSYP